VKCCPKCESPMNPHESPLAVPLWFDPKDATSPVIDTRKAVPVELYVCSKCGYLEFYRG
jgi:ribosomal protein S27AE